MDGAATAVREDVVCDNTKSNSSVLSSFNNFFFLLNLLFTLSPPTSPTTTIQIRTNQKAEDISSQSHLYFSYLPPVTQAVIVFVVLRRCPFLLFNYVRICPLSFFNYFRLCPFVWRDCFLRLWLFSSAITHVCVLVFLQSLFFPAPVNQSLKCDWRRGAFSMFLWHVEPSISAHYY